MVQNPYRYSVYSKDGVALLHCDDLPYFNRAKGHLVFNKPPFFLSFEEALGDVPDDTEVMLIVDRNRFSFPMSTVRRVINEHAKRLHRKPKTFTVIYNEAVFQFYLSDCPRTENFDPILLGV